MAIVKVLVSCLKKAMNMCVFCVVLDYSSCVVERLLFLTFRVLPKIRLILPFVYMFELASRFRYGWCVLSHPSESEVIRRLSRRTVGVILSLRSLWFVSLRYSVNILLEIRKWAFNLFGALFIRHTLRGQIIVPHRSPFLSQKHFLTFHLVCFKILWLVLDAYVTDIVFSFFL